MRILRLAHIAAEAEGLRLRTQAQRMAGRAGMAVVALVFLLAALVFVHIAVWYWLRISVEWSREATAVTLAVADVVIAAFIGLLAARSTPSRAEIEALAVRTRALEGAASTIALSTLLMPTLRLGIDLLCRRPSPRLRDR